jgi:putative sterol carrier protein
MAARKPATLTEITRHFASNPILSNFITPFQNILQKDEDLAMGFERMAARMGGTHLTGVIQFTIREAEAVRSWSLVLTPNGSDAVESRSERPQLEVLTDDRTWRQIATGQLAPVEAMGLGTVRVRGDLRLARLMVRRLANGEPQPPSSD